MTKSEARLYSLDLRGKLKSNNRDKELVDAIINSGILDKFNHIGIYYSIKEELDILPLIDYYKNKSFYLPKTIGNDIAFIKYDGNLIKGSFGIMEPSGTIVERDKIECYLVPALGFNREGYRLGYGRGYFDRYLAGYSGTIYGICYSELSNLDFNSDLHDIKFNNIIKG